MYATGGTSYVYLCYGIHHLFNVVTNMAEIPHAVLIRAVEPVIGVKTMLARTKKDKLDFYAPKIKDIMQGVLKLRVPIIVDQSVGNNWGELK